MIVEKVVTGLWRVIDMVGDDMVQRAYYGHTKREVLQFARLEFKELRAATSKTKVES